MEKQPILELKNIRKTFDKLVALDDVSFSLLPGEIHGLLGGNGAGKTTLMNILYGLYRKDQGEIFLNGEKIEINGPRDALKRGIGMVHQHFLQIANYTVLENIVLGTGITNRYTMQLQPEARKVEELCQRFGLPVELNAVISTLPIGTRQKVEILKALYRGVKILILDEPTTNLTPQEVDALFESLRVMVNGGLSIVFITHKLREVLSVCDRITVLREGRNITTLDRKDASEEVFVRAMVGEQMNIEKSVYFSRDTKTFGEVDYTAEPLLRLTHAEIERDGGNPMVEYYFPEAILGFKQGLGRLIRRRTDRGVVFVLDPRLITRNYGRGFFRSIQRCGLVRDRFEVCLEQAAAWLRA